MRGLRLAMVCGVLGLAVACGGGSSDPGPDPNPVDPTPVDPTPEPDPDPPSFVPSGAAFLFERSIEGRPAVAGLATLIRNRADLDRLVPDYADNVPPELLDPDFAGLNFLQLVGWPESDHEVTGYPRIRRIESSADGLQHVVHLEHCRVPMLPFPVPPVYWHLISLYAIPVLNGEVAFTWSQRDFYSASEPCLTSPEPQYPIPQSTDAAPLTPGTPWALRAAGHKNYGPVPLWQSRVVGNLALLKGGIYERVSDSLVAGFVDPDFSQTMMLYLEHLGNSRRDEYLRLLAIESNPSGTAHVVHAEYCGDSNSSPGSRYAIALYEVPMLIGDVEFQWTYRKPPDCQTQR